MIYAVFFIISEDITMCIYTRIAEWIDQLLGINQINFDLEAADFI